MEWSAKKCDAPKPESTLRLSTDDFRRLPSGAYMLGDGTLKHLSERNRMAPAAQCSVQVLPCPPLAPHLPLASQPSPA